MKKNLEPKTTMHQEEALKHLKFVGKKLRLARNGKSINVVACAYAIGVHPETVRRMETGSVDFRVSIFLDVCRYLEVNPVDMLPNEVYHND